MELLHLTTTPFQPADEAESRKNAFWASTGIHIVLLIILILLPLLFTESLTLKYDVVELAPPLLEKREPLEVTYWKQPVPKIKPKPIVAPPPVKPLVRDIRPPKPVEPPKPEPAKPVTPKVEPTPPEPVANKPVTPRPEPVRTGVFSTGSSAKPTTKLPAREVQTGGFGDPNGARGPGRPDKTPNIASLGSFDLPVGPGAGNGTGGAKGVRGTVASAGFGNGVATPGNGGGGASGGRPRDAAPVQTPIEIIFKPRPEYTQEARNKKLEGEVLVRALFTATGKVQVMEVVRGLGHGLDQNAVRAAQQIRFKPAQRDGQAVDMIATVHIVFQLAY